jgi:hypothetical protein
MKKDKRGDMHKASYQAAEPDLAGDPVRQRWFDRGAIVLLLALGTFLSINYFGHKLVPSSDFPSFTGISRQLLSGHAPNTFKRAPIHGAVVAGISHFTQGSNHPDLTAGWILNAILYPFIGVLIYLIAKRFIGRLPAALLAVVGVTNPWTLYMLRDPICEIHLLVYFLLAIYLMVIGSRWCYLVASLGSMVRYEAAGIIVCALLVEVVSTRDRKEWLKSLVCAAAAMVPLGLWMGATFLRGLKPGDTHYLSELGETSGGRIILGTFIDLLWQVAYKPLLLPPAYINSMFQRPTLEQYQGIMNSFHFLQFIAGLTFLSGMVYAIWKRNWHILAMVLFLFMYLVVHAVHAFAFHRFLTAVYWIPLLVSCIGMQAIWRGLDKGRRIPRPIVVMVQLAFLAGLLVWAGRLPVLLKDMGQVSVRSVPVLYVSIASAAVCVILWVVICRIKALWPYAVMLVFVASVLLSNQFSVAMEIRNGGEDDEFRQVDAWYIQSAQPGEKIACSMFMVMAMIDEKNAPYFAPLPSFPKGPGDPQKFLEICYKWNVTYVVWDSRLGLSLNDRYYWMDGLNNITMLSQPRSVGPYEFIKRCESPYTGRYVHIFRLKKPPIAPTPASGQ